MGAEASDAELDRHCRSCLAGYKTPRYWIRVDALPANAAGKIDKGLLRQTIALPRASRVTMDDDDESDASQFSRT
jgi:acyl-CoA synthetase (AMP-forming)/AMP-acid ligase II